MSLASRGADQYRLSLVYQSEPVGGVAQDDFWNLVLELATDASPRELLERAVRAERERGRTRERRWGPRTLDVDVLLVGDETSSDPEILVPHPRMYERSFVLVPLHELAPALVSQAQLDAGVGEGHAARYTRIVAITERHPRGAGTDGRVMNIALIGTGRAGSSFSIALRRVGHNVQLLHHDALSALRSPDLILLCVPDDAIANVSAQIDLSDEYVVAHVAGSRTLDVLAPHRRVGSLHPLTALPDVEEGAERLIGATFCVAGDDLVRSVAVSLEGRIISLADSQRTVYHAAAVVASNHLVALMGQVRTLAESIGLTLDDFLPLARQSLDDVASFGPDEALTGPASRGDMATIDAHLAAIPENERATYVALANAAFELSERRRTHSRA